MDGHSDIEAKGGPTSGFGGVAELRARVGGVALQLCALFAFHGFPEADRLLAL